MSHHDFFKYEKLLVSNRNTYFKNSINNISLCSESNIEL